MTADDIFKQLFFGEVVTVTVSKKEYASLRVTLFRKAKRYNNLDLTTDALTSSYSVATGQASFSLAPKKEARDYEAVLTNGTEIRSHLETSEGS